MILGIGHDMVDIRRIERLLARFGTAFEEKCFTAHERDYARRKQGPHGPASAYAKRFAAKEALAKALGTGIGARVGFQDAEVRNNASGAPYFVFSEALQHVFAQEVRCHLSLSDEYPYASAWVIIEVV